MMRIYELKINIPFMVKGNQYAFDDETGHVFRYADGIIFEYPLRRAFSGYLWMLKTEGDKYLKEVTHE
jgi:hypothetical protein